MHSPQQILNRLHDRFSRDYPDWARGRGVWPMRVPLGLPTTDERSADPVACHAWADTWRSYAGPGILEHATIRFPTGTHLMPKTLVLNTPHDVAAASPDTLATWQRCGRRLTHLEQQFPRAQLGGLIRRIVELPDTDYRRLHSAAAWLSENPASGMLLRQLPIEGIDTKWLARHSRLVLALLGDDDPSTDGDEEPGPSARIRLHRRLGLRVPPELVQVAVLDTQLREQFAGMRHFAASTDDLNRWPRHPRTVAILENKETGYAFADQPGTVVLHGQGFSVAAYARVTWIHTASHVVYWGDIDLPGLHFINDLRAHGVNAHTVLMDLPTLEHFHHLAVDGANATRTTLPHLTGAERDLYQHLAAHTATTGTGLLLEQERIPWSYAEQVLEQAMAKES